MIKDRSISIRFDNETYKIAEKLARLSRKSIPEMIKELIKTRAHVSELQISRGVKKISGFLKTKEDYKSLREMIIDEKIKKYENIH